MSRSSGVLAILDLELAICPDGRTLEVLWQINVGSGFNAPPLCGKRQAIHRNRVGSVLRAAVRTDRQFQVEDCQDS